MFECSIFVSEIFEILFHKDVAFKSDSTGCCCSSSGINRFCPSKEDSIFPITLAQVLMLVVMVAVAVTVCLVG